MGCGRKIGPFDCCSVVEGDCLELMRQIPDGVVDAVITDPPYGIDLHRNWQDVKRVGIVGDDRPFDPSRLLSFGTVVMWGANNFSDKLPTGGWLCWDKRCSSEADRMYGSSFELAWVNDQSKFKLKRILHGGVVNADGFNEPRFHPTQKPVALMEWCIEQAGFPETILDPYCGSGSTLVAAKKLGKHFIGFEISPDYCAIARKRIAAVEAQPTLFQPKPEQLTLST